MTSAFRPDQVMPQELARAVGALGSWFVIGGQAVRCFAPYRPSRDVDFGVGSAKDLEALLAELRRQGAVEIQERSIDTVHLAWNGLKVSAFVLGHLAPFVEDRRLKLEALLATKLHAIVDRGLRRDFFDLYVLLEQSRLGAGALLSAVRNVLPGAMSEGQILRALTFFDDADRELPLANEGPDDWLLVKNFFLHQVAALLSPPRRRLAIQNSKIDVTGP